MEPIAVRLVHGRAGGTFGSPNVLGSYITFMLAPTMALIAMRISRLHSALAWLALLLGGMALILSESRGAWIGSAIAFAVFVPVGLRRKWLSTRLVVGLMAAGVAAMAAFGPIILKRLAAFDNAAAQARFPLYRLAWGVIRENPVLGVGANNFATAMSNHLTVDFSTAWISTVHNKYLLVWSETGLIGLLAFGAFLAGVLWCGLRLGRMVGAPLSPFGIAVIGSVFGRDVSHAGRAVPRPNPDSGSVGHGSGGADGPGRRVGAGVDGCVHRRVGHCRRLNRIRLTTRVSRSVSISGQSANARRRNAAI
jgi:O-antigen ligase